MKTLTLLHMPFTMGMGRAAHEYKKIFETMGYTVTCMNWFDVISGRNTTMNRTDIFVAFVVPQPHLMKILKHIVSLYNRTYGIIVWETDQPPPCFVEYTGLFDHMFAPSMFTSKMFNPALTFLPHHVRRKSYTLKDVTPDLKKLLVTPGYKFYSISDFTDSRKNYDQLVQGFLECGFPGAHLVLKHNRPSPRIVNHPNIINIVGELSGTDMEFIHDTCHCYVSLSFSEGVGLGIVEAAIHDKPVLMTDYGGQNDYVKTQWKVKTSKGNVGFDEFLFTKDMTWGVPNYEHYKVLLKKLYLESPKTEDHEHTRKIVSTKFIKNILKRQGI